MLILRSTVFNIVMYGVCAALSVWCRLMARFKDQDHIMRMGQLWARITLRALKICCRIDIDLRGTALLPLDGPALIAPQHQSAFDILLWLTVLPRPAYVLKRELAQIPVFGPLMPAAGFIPVDREAGAAAMRKMVAQCRVAIADGRQIIIFPEGTRVAYGERGTIQPGILGLARILKLPVIPVSTNSGRFWGRNAFMKYPGTILLTVQEPIVDGVAQRSLLQELDRIYYGPPVDKPVH